jgi:hypothetical protein
MRTTTGLHTHDALWFQRARFGQDPLILFGVDIVGYYCEMIRVAHCLAERFQQGGFARPYRATHANAQGMFVISHVDSSGTE